MDKKETQKRLKIFVFLLSIAFIALGIRLFYLQVVMANQWELVSENNTLRTLSVDARRGDIITSDKKVLATSKPVFTVSIMAGISDEELDYVAGSLEDILQDESVTAEVIKEKIDSHSRRFEPVEIKKLIPDEPGTWEIITKIEERRRDLPGVVINEKPMRNYPEEQLSGHILGFVTQITQGQLEARKEDNYRLNDKFGQSGIEQAFELLNLEGTKVGLRGKKGLYQVEVDVHSRIVKDSGIILPATPGDNLELTIDYDLQKAMEQSMNEVISGLDNPKANAAGAVLLDVKNGDILALASAPYVNPNDFVDGSFNDSIVKNYYNNSDLAPGFNRAVQGVYPPGSTFKPITAMAALASGRVDTSDTIVCKGAYWRPPYIKCWDVHGTVDFYKALAISCNTYFQDAGYKAGIDEIDWVAKDFGLGQPLDVLGISGENKGILPTPQWKSNLGSILVDREFERKKQNLEKEYATKLAEARTFEEREVVLAQKERDLRILETDKKIQYNFNTTWQDFDTFNTSIGQGSNSYSMLQMANYVATLANGGKRWQPHLIKRITDPEGNVIKTYEPELINQVGVSQEIMTETRKGMVGVTSPGGTAYSVFKDFPADIKVGAKTGTAQTGRRGDNPDEDFHGVFIAFAPADDPQIAFAGIVEYGEHGGSTAGQIARAVFREYFGLNEKVDSIALYK